MITMFLGGLWHGAQWTFVLWGLYHGGLLVVNQAAARLPWLPASRLSARTSTFVAVVFGWVLFRAATVSDALYVWSAMVGAQGLGLDFLPPFSYLAVLGLAGAIAFAAPNTWEIDFQPRPTAAYALAAVFVLAILFLDLPSPFLYFQF